MAAGLTLPIRANVGSLEQFLSTVDKIPMLSAAEEYDLARRFRRERDREAAERLVVSHLPLVVRIARGYCGYGLAFADLIQEGAIGLMRAVRRFDPERGIRLAAYAAHFVRAQIHDFVVSNWKIVRTATTKAQRKLFFNLRRHKKRLGWVTAEEAREIAEALNVKPRDVTDMDSRLFARDVSIDIDSGDEAAPKGSVLADIPDSRFDPLSAAEASESRDRHVDRLYDGLRSLDERSREIVINRWLREDKLTLEELGGRYGISKERVRQIEQRSLARLRATFES